jgi:endonuclease/exonuclease/phosphatase family metal-dependent hydrolase
MMRIVCAALLMMFMTFGIAWAEDCVRVMTYNIHHGEGRDKKLDLDRIAEVIKARKPDVVCLQEMDRNQKRSGRLDFVAEMEKRLGMKGAFESNYNFGGGEYGNATFSRFDIVSHENHALPTPAGKEPRGCLEVTLRIGGRDVKILNTHWGLDTEQRKLQSEATIAILESGVPTILAGDFNEHPDAAGVGAVMGRIGDVLVAPQAKVDAPETFRTRRIDYVFASTQFGVREVVLIRDPPAHIASDHLPLYAELVIGN